MDFLFRLAPLPNNIVDVVVDIVGVYFVCTNICLSPLSHTCVIRDGTGKLNSKITKGEKNGMHELCGCVCVCRFVIYRFCHYDKVTKPKESGSS